jgi:hypothetical protein
METDATAKATREGQGANMTFSLGLVLPPGSVRPYG